MIPAKCDKNKYKRGIINQIDIFEGRGGRRKREREWLTLLALFIWPTLNVFSSFALSLICNWINPKPVCWYEYSEQSKTHSQHPHRFGILISSGLPIWMYVSHFCLSPDTECTQIPRLTMNQVKFHKQPFHCERCLWSVNYFNICLRLNT